MCILERGECILWNEHGVSLVEAMLTLFILMLIVGSLIPLHTKLNESLYKAKLELHASEVAYQGALQASRGEARQGTIVVEHITYNWYLEQGEICISFHESGEEHLKCIKA